MIINIFKDMQLWKDLAYYNMELIRASRYFQYNEAEKEYDLPNNKISRWFDPRFIKEMPTSRTYPNIDPKQLEEKYCLVLYNANYLNLFLISKLYNDRKDILIEDIGSGIGHLLVYLKKLGFDQFTIKENFSQMTEHCLRTYLDYFKINFELNNPNSNSRVMNNSGVPDSSVFNLDNKNNLELITCYTNNSLEKIAEDYFVRNGFKFLCRDIDNFSFAYCKENLYDNFKNKLKDYIV
jgi:hypothetical protein